MLTRIWNLVHYWYAIMWSVTARHIMTGIFYVAVVIYFAYIMIGHGGAKRVVLCTYRLFVSVCAVLNERTKTTLFNTWLLICDADWARHVWGSTVQHLHYLRTLSTITIHKGPTCTHRVMYNATNKRDPNNPADTAICSEHWNHVNMTFCLLYWKWLEHFYTSY
jgi:hypothetical protein